VNKFTDVEKYAEIPETYVEPEIESYVKSGHLRSWLKDPQARDQFFVYRDAEVSVYFNRKKEAPEQVMSRPVPPPSASSLTVRTGPRISSRGPR
jgi:translation initiation factor 3 subunit B